MNRLVYTILLFGLIPMTVSFSGMATVPDAKLTIQTVDEIGQPLTNMPVHVWLSEGIISEGMSDSKGLFVAEGPCSVKEVPIRIVKEGYYDTDMWYSFPSYTSIVDREWQPWNPVVTAVVRRMVNPIPMFARRLTTAIPTTNTCIGFDLTEADWVAPYGRGHSSDFIFRLDGFWVDYRQNDSTLALTFPNSNDGLIPTRHDVVNRWASGSKFMMPREAPAYDYTNLWRWRKMRNTVPDSDQDAIVDDVNVEGRDYVFRIRSQTNEAGAITSAYYGKIHGNIEFVGVANSNIGSWLSFTYYLNPTPNDRNLEFDPTKNLFTDLPKIQKPGDP